MITNTSHLTDKKILGRSNYAYYYFKMSFFTAAVAVWNESPWWGGHRWDADVRTAGCRVQHHPSSPYAPMPSPHCWSTQLSSPSGRMGKASLEAELALPARSGSVPDRASPLSSPGGCIRSSGVDTPAQKGCRKSPGPTTRINPDSTFWVSSQQPCHFKLILLNIISLGHSHGYAACSSWPLAGWLAEPRRFWQRDIQPDGERLPLSLAGCFLEFLLQGNVFILWNSCSLKIRTEQEHRSSVCPLGCYVPSGKREVGAAFSWITHNEQCWYVVDTLAEESKASQCTDDTVLFFISL